MTEQEFIELNPVIMGNVKLYPHRKEAYLIQGEFLKTHSFIFSTMPERLVTTLKLRCGLLDGRTYTLQQVADLFGLSKQGAQNLERKAIQELQNPMRLELLKNYTNETFDYSILDNFKLELKSLIRQDISSNLSNKYLHIIKDVPIRSLRLLSIGHVDSNKNNIITTLSSHGINTCGEFLQYIQTSESVSSLGLKMCEHRALIYAICDFVDCKKSKTLYKEIFSDYAVLKMGDLPIKKLPQNEIKARKIFDADKKRAKEEQTHQEILKSLEDFEIGKNDVSYRTYNALGRAKITSFHMLIDSYYKYGGFDKIPNIGDFISKDVIRFVQSKGIDIDDKTNKIIGISLNQKLLK